MERLHHNNDLHDYFVCTGIFADTFHEHASKRFIKFCDKHIDNYFKDWVFYRYLEIVFMEYETTFVDF